ncbi:hypothetical protein [Actinocorallia sp. A-T 12471]|uniref:hypothetical protein n=1 Tax=Actinocorallia sp. A-T 12471 TaxID=3089813 RepID=UPI0029D1C82C|nr:hypothetical protein [Actinocorallia sp. A-T 12471]MDX6738699.1 hypothetical protein [Actinocorallia sp. A-T 12471]
MRSEAREEFFLAPGLTLLNHASYGLTSRRVAAHADRIRQEIESDPTVYLGQHLTERLRELTAEVATALTLPATGTTLCANATSAAAAIISSLPLGPGSTVAAEVSLTWDSADLVERFSWPGTFDPVPRLSLDEALTQHHGWLTAGAFTRCEDLAAASVPLLTGLGAIPTTTDAYTPPRMRAFTLDGVTAPEVKASMSRAGIRVWCGPGADGSTILRIATHVYTDQADLELLCAQVKETVP